jgi:hypothetical protein
MATSQRDSDLTLPKALPGPPAGYFVLLSERNDEDALGVAKIFAWLSRWWRLLLAAGLLGAVAAVAYSFTMPKTYRSRMVLAPVTSEEGMGSVGGLSNELGGIAAMAGVDVTGDAARREQSFATLNSDGFARDFIVQENLMPLLFAKQWDAKAGRWLPGKLPPTLEAGVRKFKHNVVYVKQDHITGLVTVTVEWYSPATAAAWANRMVELVNSRLRSEATRSAEKSVEYLNNQLSKANTVELHQAISRLIEQQVNRAMVANVRPDYAYRFIDPPVAPDVRFGPQRLLYALGGAAAAMVLAYLYVYAYADRRRKVRARPDA